MTYQCVLAFGDSTVYGVELADSKNAFPQLVADHFQIPCYNMAWGGGSNFRSLRVLPETLLEHPDALVLFYYTEWQRQEWFCEYRDEEWPCDPHGYSPIGANWLNDGVPDTLAQHIKTWIRCFDSDTSQYNNFREYNAMFTVQTLCRAYAKRLIHIFGFARSIHDKVKHQQIILDHLDRDAILKFPGATWSQDGWNLGYGNFYEWAGRQKFPMGEKRHYLEPAHEALCDLILQHLDQL